MGGDGKSTATPRLRFPEFRNGPKWNNAKLEKLISTVTPPAKLPSSSYLKAGRFPIVDQSQEYICGWTDDAEAVVNEPLPVIVFGDHTCVLKLVRHPFAQGADGIKILRANASIATDYLFHSLNHHPLVTEDYKRHFSTLKERRVFYPDIAVGEQQKIAVCLTTLDEVIAAQGRKVEALKAHKRGLMQQLFPRESETLPRLRFPEFRDGPEWKRRQLLTSIHLVSGLHLSPEQYGTDGEVPYFTGPSDFTNEPEGVTKWTTESTNTAKANDTLITVKGSGVGEVWYLTVSLVAMGRQLMAVRATGCSSRFVYYFLLTKRTRFEDLASGNLIPGLTRADILGLFAAFPSAEEQQRIADCLSSLDAKIAAESEKLDALSVHKKGLIQQLFPPPEGD